ncbi:hypothetical protein H0H93_001837, partial [Arthromyces matolae]
EDLYRSPRFYLLWHRQLKQLDHHPFHDFDHLDYLEDNHIYISYDDKIHHIHYDDKIHHIDGDYNLCILHLYSYWHG